MDENQVLERGHYYEIPPLQMAGLCISVDRIAATFADADGLFSIGPSLYPHAHEVAVLTGQNCPHLSTCVEESIQERA